MAASHTGEDAHVRTLQGVLRRAAIGQSLLACPSDGAPLDELTAARLARDGEAPGPIRHMCSGFHVASLLLARHAGWPLDGYWRPDHPAQLAARDAVARIFGVRPASLRTAIDACGLLTYGFPLVEVARAFALLADPAGVADSARRPLADSLIRIRDAMVGAPQMVGGTRDASDTLLMRAGAGRLVCKGGAEGLRGIGILPAAAGAGRNGEAGHDGGASGGLAITIEDGDLAGRANRSVSVEALAQLGLLDGEAVASVDALRRQRIVDPRGEQIGETLPVFELAPLSELIG